MKIKTIKLITWNLNLSTKKWCFGRWVWAIQWLKIMPGFTNLIENDLRTSSYSKQVKILRVKGTFLILNVEKKDTWQKIKQLQQEI